MADDRDLFFLWHLEHLGILTRDGAGFDAPLWDAASGADPVTVAIVDSGIDPDHPNLAEAVAAPQVDFAARLTGAVYAPEGAALQALMRARDPDPTTLKSLVAAALSEVERHAAARGLDIDALRSAEADVQSAGDPTAAAAAFRDALRTPSPGTEAPSFGDVPTLLSELALPGPMDAKIQTRANAMAAGHDRLDVEDPSRYFGAHGTACAGLVGGRPAPSGHPFFAALPYHGVNPYCRIRSFASPYGHEIQPVTNALLAAYLSGAEVILLPRGVYDVAVRAGFLANNRRGTRIDLVDSTDDELIPEDQAARHRLESERDLFETLLRAVAARRYVVLTSGNDGIDNRLAYPASIFSSDTDAIIVGARNRRGFPSSYSNGHTLGDRVLHIISDDGTIIDRDRVHLDTDTRQGSDFDYAPHIPAGAENRYSPWAPLSLDVRGAYGYAASARQDPPEYDDGVDLGSLYTLFGGTSAASSIAAGLISLLIQADELPPQPGTNPTESIRDAMVSAGLREG